METGEPSDGRPATSQAKESIVRNVGTTRRDSINIARRPLMNRLSRSSDFGLFIRRGDTLHGSKVEEALHGDDGVGVQSENWVGAASSSTSVPPFDQMNGAMRMISGSTPRP